MPTNLSSYYILEATLAAIRAFFVTQQFHEVVIPILHDTIPLEPNIHPFSTTWKTTDEEHTFFLPTSPERTLKLMLAAGIGNCFGIGHTLRNLEGCGSKHSPEFLMVEWYREQATTADIRRDTQQLILSIQHRIDTFQGKQPTDQLSFHGNQIQLAGDWPCISFTTLFPTYCNISYDKILEGEFLYTYMQEKGYSIEGASWGELFDQLFLNEIEPHLPKQPFFLIDFPSRISPLCKATASPQIADRFEVYIAGMEVGNGNAESSNLDHIRSVFTAEHDKRAKNLDIPIDTKFLSALEQIASKKCAGIGVGIDRLVMLFSDSQTIQSYLPHTEASVQYTLIDSTA